MFSIIKVKLEWISKCVACSFAYFLGAPEHPSSTAIAYFILENHEYVCERISNWDVREEERRLCVCVWNILPKYTHCMKKSLFVTFFKSAM